MVIGSDPEYGVYERLAVLETEVAEIKAAKGLDKPTGLSKDNVILWFLITAAALGNGSSVIEVLKQVIAK